MDSLFFVLKEEGLTTLKIRYDFHTGVFRLAAAKDWDPDLDFSQYNKGFYVESILCEDTARLGTEEVKDLFGKYGLLPYLDQVLDLVRQGKHFGVDILYNEKLDIRFVCGLHSRLRGARNKSHATLAGATRRHGLDVCELDVIKDALNLSRAMTFKNVAVDIPFGGCKTTLHMGPLDLGDMEALGFLAYACDSTRCFTGPDMNLPKEMVKVINDNYTMQYCGGPGSALGDSAIPTAYGAYLALKQAVKFRTGSLSLDGMSVAVQGLGAVGYAMADCLSGEDVKLYVSDIDPARIERFIKEHPGRDITKVAPDGILMVEADILCPCAMGGILGDEEIAEIKFEYVFGPANNQLRATSQEEEIRLAGLLDERGILFQTEWWHNCAGVLAASMEYIHGFEITYQDLVEKIEAIIPGQTWKNLVRAKELGITPTECAYKSCQDVIYAPRL
ncbi:MAG: amino acid dehydrogenase [Clostridiales bacterium]|nr:amino acid dehydrogenase [Clostridiales bacterium]